MKITVRCKRCLHTRCGINPNLPKDVLDSNKNSNNLVSKPNYSKLINNDTINDSHY